MEDLIAPIMFLLVIGGVAGYFAGYLFKKVSGMALTVGILAFLFIYLAYTGTLNVNLDQINANISQFFELVAPLGVVALVSSAPFVASFVVGLFIGFRRD